MAVKVWFEMRDPTRAIRRINGALIKYAPENVQIAQADRADIVVLHVNGRLEHLKKTCQKLREQGKQYVIIQYALASTRNPDPVEWLPVWQGAKLVWSYYNLPGSDTFNFYRSPLGVDPQIFYPGYGPKDYLALTTGSGYLQESVREVILAARNVGGRVAHLGADLHIPGVDCYQNLFDDTLRELYQRCQYVSGLRRKEGFELPAAEGLLCGARPLLYDREHYSHWYGSWGAYIPETNRDQIVTDLTALFRQPYRPVQLWEIATARRQFNWESIICEFWGRIV